MPKSLQRCSTNMSHSSKDPGSSNSSILSLAVSLPFACWLATRFSPPPARAAARLASSSRTMSNMLLTMFTGLPVRDCAAKCSGRPPDSCGLARTPHTTAALARLSKGQGPDAWCKSLIVSCGYRHPQTVGSAATSRVTSVLAGSSTKRSDSARRERRPQPLVLFRGQGAEEANQGGVVRVDADDLAAAAPMHTVGDPERLVRHATRLAHAAPPRRRAKAGQSHTPSNSCCRPSFP